MIMGDRDTIARANQEMHPRLGANDSPIQSIDKVRRQEVGPAEPVGDPSHPREKMLPSRDDYEPPRATSRGCPGYVAPPQRLWLQEGRQRTVTTRSSSKKDPSQSRKQKLQ
jgi:hypothetical protein